MSDSALAHVALSFQPVWGPGRDLVAVVLDVKPLAGKLLDGALLDALLRESWPVRGPQLVVRTASAALLAELARHAQAEPMWLAIEPATATAPAVRACLEGPRMAVPLVWSAPLGTPTPGTGFVLDLVTLSMEQTLAVLARAARLAEKPLPEPTPAPARDRFYEGIASEKMAVLCLDQERAAGVVGWPVEEAAHRARRTPMPPDRRVILALLSDIERDASVDALEHRLGTDPVLAYRFLRYANCAALGLRAEVGTLRHGLMMVGAANLRRWLTEELPHSATDADSRPLRQSLVLQAQLMEQLLDAGTEHELRRELYLCGLFAGLDLALGGRLCDLLHAVPLAQRVTDAAIGGRGPYAAYLSLARAMARPGAADVAAHCGRESVEVEDANRGLLRMLCALRMEREPALMTADCAA